MKALASTLLAALFTSLAAADTHAGWHDLTALSHWVHGNGNAIAPGKWVVEDGVLHLTGKGGGSLFSKKHYQDFELIFDWKISPKGNSGVKYRMAPFEGRGMLGAEYQVYDDSGNPYARGSTASLYDIVAPDRDAKKSNPLGEWNRSRIVAKGKHIQHFLNGKKVVDVTIGTESWNEALAASKFRGLSDFAAQKGPLMLQDHGSPVWFRDIKIKPLD